MNICRFRLARPIHSSAAKPANSRPAAIEGQIIETRQMIEGVSPRDMLAEEQDSDAEALI
jgi:hypothetical protein